MDLKNAKYNPFFVKDYYLFEYSAIDPEVRRKFHYKLIKRKGASGQKNVKLMCLLEEAVNEKMFHRDDFSCWDKTLDVTNRMLDCHKARLLKQLREFSFKWESDVSESKIEQIRRRFAKGMLREARTELSQLENEILSSTEHKTRLPELFEISEKFIQIYNYLKDKRRSNHYYKLAGVYYNQIKRSRLSGELKNDITVRYQLVLSVKLMSNRFKVNNMQKAAKKLEHVLAKYGDNIDPQHVMKIHHKLGLIYNVLRKKELSIDAFIKGKQLANRTGKIAEELIYESFLYLRRFTENNKLAPAALKFHRDNFAFISSNYTDVQQLIDFEFNFLRFLIFSGGEETEAITEDFVAKQILFSRKADALNSWYLELSDQLSSNVYRVTGTESEFKVEVNNSVLAQLTELNRQSVSKFSGLFSPNSLVILYVNIAEQEFWKGTEADFELAENFIKKTQRITKLYYINISGSWVISTKLGLKIFEMLATQRRERVYRRFSNAITRFIDLIKSEKQSFNIASDLAKLIYIANRLRSVELDNRLYELLIWISSNQPEVLSSFRTEVK
jgi:hypothetical protein